MAIADRLLLLLTRQQSASSCDNAGYFFGRGCNAKLQRNRCCLLWTGQATRARLKPALRKNVNRRSQFFRRDQRFCRRWSQLMNGFSINMNGCCSSYVNYSDLYTIRVADLKITARLTRLLRVRYIKL